MDNAGAFQQDVDHSSWNLIVPTLVYVQAISQLRIPQCLVAIRGENGNLLPKQWNLVLLAAAS